MNRIKYYRAEQGLQQKDIASAVGISVGHLSHLERETRNPSTATTALIADALGKTVIEVFYPNETKILIRKEGDTVNIKTMFQADATTDLVIIEDGQAVTTSLKVAEYFGKDHFIVLRDIRNILKSVASDFGAYNFVLSSYVSEQNKEQPMYLLTRDGFVLVAMGYTGPKAMQFKVAYITAFNTMEAKLQGKTEPLTNEELTDRAAHRIAGQILPAFTKTISKQLSKDIVDQVRNLPHGETLLPPEAEPTDDDPATYDETPTLDKLPNILTVNHIKDYLNIGRRQAYELVHSEGFPAMKVASVIRIEKPRFIKWLDEQVKNQLT
jgi:Rha family phage regulatory protein